MTARTAGIYFLEMKHAGAIQRLVSDPAIAATTRIPHPYPSDGAREFVERQLKDRAAGSAYVFAIEDRGELVGACGLHGIGGGQARELGYWVGLPYWGKGYATFATGMVLEFAFRNLQLERVHSRVLETNAASLRVLAKNGFLSTGREPQSEAGHDAGTALIVHSISRTQWVEARNRPALDALHPLLKVILAAELAAGNELMETGGGWPDADSVFVRLKQPFRTRPDPLPAGIDYTEPNDPHWWRADYSTRSPRHVLAS